MKIEDVKNPKSYTHLAAVKELTVVGMHSQADILQKTGDINLLNSEALKIVLRMFD